MFYLQYLSSLCHRRQWSEPSYETYASRSGYKCVVRVNHREYRTDTGYSTEQLAIEHAAMRAYQICRNFSVNDGRFPSGRDMATGGVLQGMPVAIGTGRRGGSQGETGYVHRGYGEEISESGSSLGSRSGGSSPGSADFPVSYRTGRSESGGSRGSLYGGSRRR